MLSKKQVTQFQQLIFDWFAVNQRNLPWRHTHDPYAVMVSEVMLQQTQVDRVKKYWADWLERWPTFEALANAPTADVIRAWKGLGYNRRAVNLQRAAQMVVTNGGFSNFTNAKDISSLPGIGPGTAGALMNFVRNMDTPFLEVNLKRIFQRLAFGPETVVGWAKERELLDVADAVLPQGAARVWPHALMDFGALACRPNDPFCENCPLGSLVRKRNAKFKDKPVIIIAKTKQRFEETNRYWRGQILDLLRAHSLLDQTELFSLLPTKTVLTEERFIKLLSDLERDRLLRLDSHQVQLP